MSTSAIEYELLSKMRNIAFEDLEPFKVFPFYPYLEKRQQLAKKYIESTEEVQSYILPILDQIENIIKQHLYL
ncbi:MAG: hypothetical protein V4666_08405 [Bacteroidota bacterium]